MLLPLRSLFEEGPGLLSVGEAEAVTDLSRCEGELEAGDTGVDIDADPALCLPALVC